MTFAGAKPAWAWLLLLAACALVALAYWPGLSGPLLLDDFNNLADVSAWLTGERTWQSAIFNNRSGPLGRPIAMASFVLDAALWGRDVWHLKLSNLLVHLACGVALFGVYRSLLTRDPDLGRFHWLAAFLALIWMALPINVSSVLYVVQRMAMLSALFMLLALWLFIAARKAIEEGRRSGIAALWIGVPVLTALAAFSKENGLLVPLLVFVIEIFYFRPAPGQRRPTSVRLFLALTVLLPGALACLLLAMDPQRILGGYAGRDFTLAERLLSEPRILWDYISAIIVPYGPHLGLFHDNYPKSTGLLTPWTTLAAIIGWLLVMLGGWRVRLRHPAIAAGIFLFLAGHAMESGIWPLELYFEHRNYLPSIGVVLAVAGVVAALLQHMKSPTPLFKRALIVAAVALPVTYLLATHGRANVWSSHATLFAQELRFNPDSPRLRSFLAADAMRAANMELALIHINAADRNSGPAEAMTLSLWRMLAHCAGKAAPPPDLYTALEHDAQGPIDSYAMIAWEELAQKVEQGQCPGLDTARLISIGQKWLQRTPQSGTAHPVWRTRYYLARLLASQSRFEEAIATADRAWRDSSYNNGIGVFLFQVNATEDRLVDCRKILDVLERAEGGGDLKLDRAIETFREALQTPGYLDGSPTDSSGAAHASVLLDLRNVDSIDAGRWRVNATQLIREIRTAHT